jgi:MFS family permease
MPSMPVQPYRAVLRAPGVPRLFVVGFLARGPVIAMSVVLTLHVVLSLHLDYARAGLVATVLTVSTAIGSPWRGRAIDRLGLRRALLPSIVLGGGIWLLAPFVGYAALLGLAAVGGVFGLPAFAVIRQALSVAVAPEHRRATLALDSISVELSFMTGPGLAVVAATTWSTRGVLFIVGAAQIVAGAVLWLLNPPVRTVVSSTGEPAEPVESERAAVTARPARHRAPVGRGRPWFSPALLAVYIAGTGAALVLAGSEVAVVAQLRHLGHLRFTAAVFVVWGVTSIVGGFVYGALRREIGPPVVLFALGALTLPIGLAHGPTTVALLIGVAGLFCAPALTATSAAVTHLVREEFRGEAMGWQGTAITTGSGLGAPLAGFAADRSGPPAAYLASGAAGMGLALVAGVLTLLFARRSRPARNTGARVPADTLVD